MSLITLQLDRKLIEKVKIIAENKFPLRNINSYAEATREALIEFIKKNQRFSRISEFPNSKILEEIS
ncbi:MAG: hypothetical protein ACFFDF_12950 [Candidatus Odinarchaeota archaeon]